MARELVLVTGGSGFLGTHCVMALLARGHPVRATVRSVERGNELRAALARARIDASDLTTVQADLLGDAGWAEAADGCTYILHTASPFPARMPRDPEDLVRPAREGALRALRAAREARVARVVMTSSFAAVGYGNTPHGPEYTEEDWSDPEAGIGAYAASKTLAERAAWEFTRREGGPALAVVNPVGIIGPVPGPRLSTSIQLVRRVLSGSLPGLPRISIPLVDVRDVAELHLAAMEHPAAAGERFLAVAGPAVPLRELAAILRTGLAGRGLRIPSRELPDWLVRAAALASPPLRQFSSRLGGTVPISNRKATTLLGWEPRPVADSLLDTANSLLELGLV